jgi:DNA (cytosine-5)-methyltransferase 1
MINSFLLYRYGIDSETETIDVVSGGAPCESFSIAGTRTDGDKRDDLFSNIIRIAKAVKSKSILFENVKGMFSKARNGVKGNAFEYICDRFENTKNRPAYRLVSRDPSTVLLKACDYGVPQIRERLFLVSIRRDLSDINFEYPEKEYGPNRKYPFVTVKDALSDLPKVGMAEESTQYKKMTSFESENQQRFVSIMRGEYVDNEMNTITPTHLRRAGLFDTDLISCHRGPGHVKRKQELLSLIPVGSSMKAVYDQLVQRGEFEEHKHLFPRTIYGSRNIRLLLDQPSFTVTSHCLDEILHPYLNRAVTPREAARLQSFPDWYQFAGPYVQFHGDKEQDKYEQIGDAIPPLLAYALAKQFVKCLSTYKED